MALRQICAHVMRQTTADEAKTATDLVTRDTAVTSR